MIRQIATPGPETEWPSREDWYYRPHAFPIVVPPLYEQTADDPLLVRYFGRTYAQHRRKRIDTIPAVALDALTVYPCPGNARQLQNLIEHTGHQDRLLTPVDYLHDRPPASRSPQRPADPTVESKARPICGSWRQGATRCRRGGRVKQGRMFRNGTRCLAVKHATWRWHAVAGPRERPSGAAAPLSLLRTMVCSRLETRGRLRRPA